MLWGSWKASALVEGEGRVKVYHQSAQRADLL